MNRSLSNVDPNSPSPDERGDALNQLVATADANAIAVLGHALLDSHWPVCDELADALVRIGTDLAERALVKALNARRHHIRSAAVKALATVGGPETLVAIQSLAIDPSYEVRQDVAEAVRKPSETLSAGRAARSPQKRTSHRPPPKDRPLRGQSHAR